MDTSPKASLPVRGVSASCGLNSPSSTARTAVGALISGTPISEASACGEFHSSRLRPVRAGGLK
ncbi:Uncharacterised protein [Mycobacteroides abscessus subsp. abscessus]|nr:Uncharacterised protein [Mycobacteroides abscessus subsp. abscessus]